MLPDQQRDDRPVGRVEEVACDRVLGDPVDRERPGEGVTKNEASCVGKPGATQTRQARVPGWRDTLQTMAARRSLALLLACAVAGATASAALAAGNFQGPAQRVALTAAQAKYKALTGSAAAAKPPLDKQRGYRSGWQTSYLKGTAASPVEAYSLVYVYDTAANAKRAYANSCQACSSDLRTQGITMKFMLTDEKGYPGGDPDHDLSKHLCRDRDLREVAARRARAGRRCALQAGSTPRRWPAACRPAPPEHPTARGGGRRWYHSALYHSRPCVGCCSSWGRSSSSTPSSSPR